MRVFYYKHFITRMEYNTKRNNLTIREYGRNVQKMVEQLKLIEDRDKRTEAAKAVVRTMDQLNQNTDTASNKADSIDYWHKLWDHLFAMSNYELDVDSPFPKVEKLVEKPTMEKPDYNKHHIRLRTYGRNMERIIKEVSQYPAEQRERLAKPLVNHLKMLYLTFNRDSVNDNVIKQQLSDLSDGLITVPEDYTLAPTKELNQLISNNAFFVTPPAKKKKNAPVQAVQ